MQRMFFPVASVWIRRRQPPNLRCRFPSFTHCFYSTLVCVRPQPIAAWEQLTWNHLCDLQLAPLGLPTTAAWVTSWNPELSVHTTPLRICVVLLSGSSFEVYFLLNRGKHGSRSQFSSFFDFAMSTVLHNFGPRFLRLKILGNKGKQTKQRNQIWTMAMWK